MHKKKSLVVIVLLLALFARVSSALAAPADISISFSENQREWIEQACQHATPGGCEHFRAHEAPLAWLALRAMNASEVTLRFKEEIAGLGQNFALWRLELSARSASGEIETREIYATVLSQNGQLLLDRLIVFDQTLMRWE